MPAPSIARILKGEDLLGLDDVVLHPAHLGDRDDAAHPVALALDLNDQVDGAGDLPADRLLRELATGHHDHVFETHDGIAGAVGVDRTERAVVAGIHRLEHVEALGTADLAQDDAVRSHAQRIPHQVALIDLAGPLGAHRARLQPDHVRLLQLQLRGILDRDDPVGRIDLLGQGVEQGRLAGAGPARDDDVLLGAHRAIQDLDHLRGQRVACGQRFERQVAPHELADRDGGAVDRQGKRDDVHAAAVGQAGIDHGRRLVDAAPGGRGDPLGRVEDVLLVEEGDRRQLQLAEALDEDLTGAVDQDVVDRVVGQERLNRPDAEHLVEQFGRDLIFLVARDLHALLVTDPADQGLDLGLELVPAHRGRLERIDLVVDIAAQDAPVGRGRRLRLGGLLVAHRLRQIVGRHGHGSALGGCRGRFADQHRMALLTPRAGRGRVSAGSAGRDGPNAGA